ncbi:metal-sensitive transcriptional regulator [Arthrobacter sp. YD4]|uniref:metal-sensitive transcriptional regulator n=1 Tax=Arthrobacter sp. YD4 TaxID=3058043 RepID=UPI0025B35213|nr:metal-sensitive transcriptional regulator [Arthrobacter sp. YD4]MDN3936205.1 metal-sensitive transcriptional regulator [Arthrobacter sp. YD4]
MSASDSSVAAPGDQIPAGADADTAAAADQHEGPHTGSGQHGYSANKDAYLKRLKRIEGQVRGIARMVDEDKYCIDILTQVAAVTKALHAVSLGLVEEHIGHCVVGAAAEPDPELRSEAIDAKVKEATDAIGRLLR